MMGLRRKIKVRSSSVWYFPKCERMGDGFNILGACTPGTYSDDVRKIVNKLLIYGQIFSKTSVCVSCFDDARMNVDPLSPIHDLA